MRTPTRHLSFVVLLGTTAIAQGQYPTPPCAACAAPAPVVVRYEAAPCCQQPGLLYRLFHPCAAPACTTCCSPTPCQAYCTPHPILDGLHTLRCKLTPPCLRGESCAACCETHHCLFDCFHKKACCPPPAPVCVAPAPPPVYAPAPVYAPGPAPVYAPAQAPVDAPAPAVPPAPTPIAPAPGIAVPR